LRKFESARILGGQFHLSEQGVSLEWFMGEVTKGHFNAPDNVIDVQREGTARDMATNLAEFDADALSQRKRITVLTLNAGQTPTGAKREGLDWELRAAPSPYDGLVDLAETLGLSASRLDHAFFSIHAPNAVEIDLSSAVSGTIARPACFLADGLSPEDFVLHYRVRVQQTIVERGTIAGTDMEWSRAERANRGVAEISVPAGAVLQCFAVVNEFAHHHSWIVDPATFPNPMRVMLETYDPSLSTMSTALFDAVRKGGGDTRTVEAAVGWLLWMNGFSAAHLGATKQLQDGPDLIATTPSGNVVIVECTTGMLKADKLARLVERRANLRKRLDASGNGHARIVGAFVTTLDRSEVEADLEQAERVKIHVITREDLQRGLDRCIVLQNADVAFREAEEAIEAAFERRSGNNL
jgi:hypothetical protein